MSWLQFIRNICNRKSQNLVQSTIKLTNSSLEYEGYEQGETLAVSPTPLLRQRCPARNPALAGSSLEWGQLLMGSKALKEMQEWFVGAGGQVLPAQFPVFLTKGVFPCLFHAQKLQSLKYPKDSICFPRSSQVTGKSRPSCKAPGDTWHLLNILSQNIFISFVMETNLQSPVLIYTF